MKINFIDLKIHNFMSFKDTYISFTEAGYNLITGINNNPRDNAKSNGSGKSSIWNALTYCLTGETVNGISKNLVNIHSPSEDMSVELNFKVNDSLFKLIRSKTDKGADLKLYVNNEDKSGKGIRDTEKILNDYLPDLTSSLIGSVIILGQGLPKRFSDNTPSGRKEILEKLSKSDFMIEDIKTKISNRKSTLNTQIRDLDNNILKDNSTKRAYEVQVSSYKDKLVNLGSEDQFDKNINEYQEKLNQLKPLIDNYKESLNSISLNLSEENSSLISLSESFNSKSQSLRDEYNSKSQNLTQLNYNLKSEINALNREINNLESIRDICPTCGQKIPNVVKPDTSSLRGEKSSKEYEQVRVENQLKDLEKDYTSKLDLFTRELKEVKNSKENNIKKLNEDKKVLDLKLNSTQDDYLKYNSKLQEYLNYKNNYKDRVEEYGQNIFKLTQLIDQLDKNILYNNSLRDNLNNHLTIVNDINTLANRDFRGFLLSNIINFINTRVKDYGKDVFDAPIEFLLEGNNINILYDNRPIENLSGGEKQKVDLIIQFTLRDMLCQFMSFSSNILVIDEAFDYLDSVGAQKILDMISNKLKDVESIYIISHHSEELSIPYDNEITVVKDENGISSII